jgi:branched-chain amino acid transport system substrate-binding protein
VQKAIDDELPKAGGKVVQSISVSATATDFGPQVDQLRDTKADLIYFAVSSGTQIPTLAQQLRAAGVKAQFMSYGGTDIPAVISSDDTQGMLFTTQHVNLQATNAPTTYLTTQFAKKYPGTTLTTAQVNYFNAALIIGQAIQKLEAAKKTVNGANVLAQIIKGHEYQFAGGSVIINKDGTTSTPIDITKLVSKKETVVKSVAAAK